MMGGGIHHGNRTALAEFNIYADPEAAQIVFASGLPVVMAGLDVTEKATLSVEQIESLKEKGRVSRLAYELLSFTMKQENNLDLRKVPFMIFVLLPIFWNRTCFPAHMNISM